MWGGGWWRVTAQSEFHEVNSGSEVTEQFQCVLQPKQRREGRGLVLVGPTGHPEGTSVFPPGQNCCSHSEDEEVTSSPKLQCKLIKSETLTFFLTLYQVNS